MTNTKKSKKHKLLVKLRCQSFFPIKFVIAKELFKGA